jgi:carboxyl-terminal processing protease
MKTGFQVSGPLWMGVFILCSMSCRKPGYRPGYSTGSPESINSWVLDSMKMYYYWNSSLPDYINVKRNPSEFFRMITAPSDRFSALVNPDLPQTYPPSLVHTLGFDLITFQNSNAVVQTMITLVVPGSGAASKGLLRGDIVNTMDGLRPGAANIAYLTERAIARQTVTLEIAGRSGPVTIGRLSSTETPVYTYKAFQSAGKTYGYLFLNSFEDAAVNQLVRAFSYFKQQQVQELLLDLRYNPGGNVAVAAALAAMIVPSALQDDTFIEYRGNAKAGRRKSSFSKELLRLPKEIRRDFAQFADYRLGLRRVYVLTGSHTASAAELMINALRPYIAVVQLGAKSLGKDMASFVIRDYRNPQIVPGWEIYPMVFKLYNAAGRGDYGSGLVPDEVVNELSVLPLKAFGDLNDPLISQCLDGSGGGATARLKGRQPATPVLVWFDSRNREDITAGIQLPRD